jgi:hypothetical protein
MSNFNWIWIPHPSASLLATAHFLSGVLHIQVRETRFNINSRTSPNSFRTRTRNLARVRRYSRSQRTNRSDCAQKGTWDLIHSVKPNNWNRNSWQLRFQFLLAHFEGLSDAKEWWLSLWFSLFPASLLLDPSVVIAGVPGFSPFITSLPDRADTDWRARELRFCPI